MKGKGTPRNKKPTRSELALLDGAQAGKLRAVQVLLRRGAAGVNVRDPRGTYPQRTPLMHAAAGGHRKVVKLLLAAGAEVDARDRGVAALGTYGGNTALTLALENGHADIAAVLLDAGADPNARGGESNALGAAAERGMVGMVRRLIALGADVDGKPSSGWPPLLSALTNRKQVAARTLIEAGADPNTCGDGRINVLTTAAEEGFTELCALLLERGADPNRRDDDHYTPLMGAALHGREQVVQLLLAHGARADARDREGNTALAFAELHEGHARYARVASLLRAAQKSQARKRR